jgi:TIR domain/Pentapeptide repeats (8 copies)
MADLDQLAILRQGPDLWNRWRTDHKFENCDLSGADLSGVDLRGANLRGANLFKVDLGDAELGDADLSGANLIRVHLGDAHLRHALLSGADLSGADLIRADFADADLSAANLSWAGLKRAELKRANLDATIFQGTYLYETIFADVNLAKSRGLDSCVHGGPSTIDLRTLEKSGMLPLVFLRGCGLPESLIDYLPSLLDRAFEFYSCFICHSHADRLFARRLHDQLQDRGIRCWLDEHQLQPGDDLHSKADEDVKLWEKTVLCCSETSLTSWWVGEAIESALKNDRALIVQSKKSVSSLIPVILDGLLFGRLRPNGNEELIKSRLAADFTNWQSDSTKFDVEFEKVVRALRMDGDSKRPLSATIDLSQYL